MHFVVNFIRFPTVKNCQDRLTFDKVRAKIKVASTHVVIKQY